MLDLRTLGVTGALLCIHFVPALVLFLAGVSQLHAATNLRCFIACLVRREIRSDQIVFELDYSTQNKFTATAGYVLCTLRYCVTVWC